MRVLGIRKDAGGAYAGGFSQCQFTSFPIPLSEPVKQNVTAACAKNKLEFKFFSSPAPIIFPLSI